MDLRIPIEFTKRGFFIASIDYQGHGESGGNLNNINSETGVPALAEDCINLLDVIENLPIYALKINSSQIGLIGHSLGGMVVLMNGALDERFNATVAWAPLVDPSTVGFHFDPIIHGPGWEEKYQRTVAKMFSYVKPRHILWVSLGTLRFVPALKKVMENRFPDSRLLDEELLLDFDGKMRYEKSR